MFERITFKTIERQLEEQGFKRATSKYEQEGKGLTLEGWLNYLEVRRSALWLAHYDSSWEEIKDMYLVLAKGCEGQPNARWVLYYRTKEMRTTVPERPPVIYQTRSAPSIEDEENDRGAR